MYDGSLFCCVRKWGENYRRTDWESRSKLKAVASPTRKLFRLIGGWKSGGRILSPLCSEAQDVYTIIIRAWPASLDDPPPAKAQQRLTQRVDQNRISDLFEWWNIAVLSTSTRTNKGKHRHKNKINLYKSIYKPICAVAWIRKDGGWEGNAYIHIYIMRYICVYIGMIGSLEHIFISPCFSNQGPVNMRKVVFLAGCSAETFISSPNTLTSGRSFM